MFPNQGLLKVTASRAYFVGTVPDRVVVTTDY